MTESNVSLPGSLSIIIPAHNEEGSIRHTVEALYSTLTGAGTPHEILVVDDHSSDGTAIILQEMQALVPTLRLMSNLKYPRGFGYAIRLGLEEFEGDAACIVMADASDDPADVVKYWEKLREGYDCVFGTRFARKSKVLNYPRHKLILNRMANYFIKILFRLPLNDTTNAFKCYRRHVIEGLQPILACHFNLTVELPLKAIARGYSYAVVPINWYGRVTGESKLRIKEMGSRYLFIILYIWLEKHLSRGDYHRSHER